MGVSIYQAPCKKPLLPAPGVQPRNLQLDYAARLLYATLIQPPGLNEVSVLPIQSRTVYMASAA